MATRQVDIKEFASHVERMCEFILNQIQEKDSSPDLTFIQKLKQDATDIQFNPRLYGDISLQGLDDHIRGIIHTA